MKQESAFVISEFTNPSGEVVFRVTGWVDGKRIRKNFPTRAEAKTEADTLEIQRLQGETGVRPTITRLAENQLHEAEAVFKRLAESRLSSTSQLTTVCSMPWATWWS